MRKRVINETFDSFQIIFNKKVEYFWKVSQTERFADSKVFENVYSWKFSILFKVYDTKVLTICKFNVKNDFQIA